MLDFDNTFEESTHFHFTYLLQSFSSSLGSYVHYMRLYHKLGKLSSDKVSRLKDIGFVFDVAESIYNSRCDQLASYYETHGNFFVTYAEDPVRLSIKAQFRSISSAKKTNTCCLFVIVRHCINGRTIKSRDVKRAIFQKSWRISC